MMQEFSELYREYVGRVYAFVAYRVANRADAEDLTQATFERAIAHWASYDRDRAGVATWLLTIARNLAIDHHRTGARRGEPLEIDDLADDGPSSGVAVPAVDLGISAELGIALAQLSDRERELIALRFGADLGGREIAGVTGLTLANVQQIQSRALRKLREALGPTAGRRSPAQAGRSRLRTRS